MNVASTCSADQSTQTFKRGPENENSPLGVVSKVSFTDTVWQGVSCFLFFKVIWIRVSSRLDCVHLRMSKCAYESRFSKRKKAIAKADALRAVTEKTKPLIQSLVCQKGLEILQHEYFKIVLAEF